MPVIGYLAFNLSDSARVELLSRFKPKFNHVVAQHVTLKYGANESESIPDVRSAKVIGYAFNDSIECVVVEIEGTPRRPDGGIYHITLSHNENARPVDSNTLLRESGFSAVEEFALEIEPKFKLDHTA